LEKSEKPPARKGFWDSHNPQTVSSMPKKTGRNINGLPELVSGIQKTLRLLELIQGRLEGIAIKPESNNQNCRSK